jgi:hypothetical protein
VLGPVENLAFSAVFIGPEPDGSGFAEAHICVNGYLEANPTG